MFTLFHHPFCPRSRFVRLALGEHGLDTRLVEELAWDRREAFLALNPAGDTPVLIAEGTPAMPGPSLPLNSSTKFMARRSAIIVLAAAMNDRIEVRRLMSWFNDKFFEEASGPLVTERIYKRFMKPDQGGGAPRPTFCAPQRPMCAIIWPISAGWRGRGISWPATSSPMPISPPQPICRRWTIWAMCHGTKTTQPRRGTCGSNPARRSARC
jgi:hypothetical protein